MSINTQASFSGDVSKFDVFKSNSLPFLDTNQSLNDKTTIVANILLSDKGKSEVEEKVHDVKPMFHFVEHENLVTILKQEVTNLSKTLEDLKQSKIEIDTNIELEEIQENRDRLMQIREQFKENIKKNDDLLKDAIQLLKENNSSNGVAVVSAVAGLVGTATTYGTMTFMTTSAGGGTLSLTVASGGAGAVGGGTFSFAAASGGGAGVASGGVALSVCSVAVPIITILVGSYSFYCLYEWWTKPIGGDVLHHLNQADNNLNETEEVLIRTNRIVNNVNQVIINSSRQTEEIDLLVDRLIDKAKKSEEENSKLQVTTAHLEMENSKLRLMTANLEEENFKLQEMITNLGRKKSDNNEKKVEQRNESKSDDEGPQQDMGVGHSRTDPKIKFPGCTK